MASDEKSGDHGALRDRAPEGADPRSMHPETSWAATMMELQAGRFPDLDRIARALRFGDSPIPRPVRNFLAAYLAGEKRRPPGRPKMDLFHKRLMVGVIDSVYALELDKANEEKANNGLSGMPSEVAADRVAAEINMSVDSVRDALHRRNGWELE